MRILISLLFFCCLLPSCSNQEQEPSDVVVDAPANDKIAELLLPNRDSLPYPVYSSFDQVAALFDEASDEQTLVINFWATWCKPCVEEIPYFEQLANETDARVIMVSLDFKKDVATKLKKFVEQRKMKLPVIALADGDYSGWIDRVEPSWAGAIPVTLIRRGKKQVFHPSKFADYDELRTAVAAVFPS